MPFKDKDAKNEWRKQRARRHLDWIRSIKVERGCADCGYNEHHAGLEFDHLGNKSYNLAEMARYSKKRIMEEIDKCDVVCGTCHNIRTFLRLELE